MLSILGLCGLAFAAAILPNAIGDTDNDQAHDSDGAHSENTASKAAEIGSIAIGEDEAAGDHLPKAEETQTVSGTDLADVLFGSDVADTIHGNAGADMIYGGNGDDVLYGAEDAEGDIMIGGDGHDTFFAGADDNVIGGSGDDRVFLEGDGPVFIDDYNPDDDQIILEYDPAEPAPALTTHEVETGIGLFANGKHVATFGGIATLDTEDVNLIPDAA